MREWRPHSEEKISIFEDYIAAFARAAQRAPNRVYIDAFAGDTVNILSTTGDIFAGSAEIAIGVRPEFTHVALFEKSAKRAKQLQRMRDDHPSQAITVYEGDCNALMPTALDALPRKAPTFAFLDPDGMELDWRTVKLLADHKRTVSPTKVEMWILVSTSGIVRLLGDTKDPVGEARNVERVAHLYGARGPWERVRAARRAHELEPDEARRARISSSTWTGSPVSATSTSSPDRFTTAEASSTSWCSPPITQPEATSCSGHRSNLASSNALQPSSTCPRSGRRTKIYTPAGARSSRSSFPTGRISTMTTRSDGRRSRGC